jgi:hypothetical protein
MVPSVESCWLVPNVIPHELLPVAESVHRPARLTGGAMARGPLLAGAAGAAVTPIRSLSLQAASNAAQTMIGAAAKRISMTYKTGESGNYG